MTCEIGDLLAGLDVVQGDDPRVTSRGYKAGGGAEGDGANGMHEAGERVRQAARVIVEDVYAAIFVTRYREAPIIAL